MQYIVHKAVAHPRRSGPKPKVSKNDRRRMQTIVEIRKRDGKKCTSKDILTELKLNVSRRTVQRNLRSMHFDYKNIPHKFTLSTKCKRNRVDMAKKYIIDGVDWKSVAFSDEKQFTLEGCNSYYSWM